WKQKTLECLQLIKDKRQGKFIDIQSIDSGLRNYYLALLFKLVSRVPNTTVELKNIVEKEFYQMGIEAIQRVHDTAINDPKLYVKRILKILITLFKFVQGDFNSEPDFMTSLDKAGENFINKNKVTEAADNTDKLPELLAQYCDALLRKHYGKDRSQKKIQSNYGKIFELIALERLVLQLSESVHYEGLMISKLREACGFEYTSKLQQIFQDIGFNKILINLCQQYYKNQNLANIVDLSAMVLNSKFSTFSEPANFALPIEFKAAFESYKNFQAKKFKGLKLKLLHELSKAEMQMLYPKQKNILQVSTYQMVILLLFNKFPSCTVKQIQDETKIRPDLLFHILGVLLKSNLIKCLNINNNTFDEDFNESDIKMAYIMQINENFSGENIKKDLILPLKSAEQKTIIDLNQSITIDGRMVIQAEIVRIMKNCKVLEKNLLIQEVIQQLSSRFQPEIPVIEERIRKLIEQEFLRRQLNDNDMLCYLDTNTKPSG
ncbi:unnamed protein product, partial [Rotaria sp. Silwood1]